MMKYLGMVIGLVALCLACQASAQASKNAQVVFETNQGKIVLVMFEDKAPITSRNLLQYVDDGFYNGTILHQAIPGVVVQGGGYTKELRPKSARQPIKNEAYNGLKNHRGTLAMARTNVPDSATSQFFHQFGAQCPL